MGCEWGSGNIMGRQVTARCSQGNQERLKKYTAVQNQAKLTCANWKSGQGEVITHTQGMAASGEGAERGRERTKGVLTQPG